jgi:hypothetical protein
MLISSLRSKDNGGGPGPGIEWSAAGEVDEKCQRFGKFLHPKRERCNKWLMRFL